MEYEVKMSYNTTIENTTERAVSKYKENMATLFIVTGVLGLICVILLLIYCWIQKYRKAGKPNLKQYLFRNREERGPSRKIIPFPLAFQNRREESSLRGYQ